MTPEEFKCDILDILENDDYRSSLLEKLETFYRNFRSNVIAQIEKRLLYEKGTVIFLYISIKNEQSKTIDEKKLTLYYFYLLISS